MTAITANYDEPWKEAIGDYFELFLSFFYPQIHQEINWNQPPISLDKELEQIIPLAETEKRYADKLFKVWLLDEQEVWILIHIEVQSQYDQNFRQRMFIYNYRAFDLYHQPVISLAILGDESQSWRPQVYQYGIGESQLFFQFSIVKLLDYQWEELETNNNPFSIIVMAHLKTQATTNNLTEREQWKWNLSRLLYKRDYNRKQIADLYKVIDFMMTLSEELQYSFEEKLTQYQEERKMRLLSNIEERASIRISQENIMELLEDRFENLPESLVEKINQIKDLNRLKYLLRQTIHVNSVAEFEHLINDSLDNQNESTINE